jgi:hypothetical protein
MVHRDIPHVPVVGIRTPPPAGVLSRQRAHPVGLHRLVVDVEGVSTQLCPQCGWRQAAVHKTRSLPTAAPRLLAVAYVSVCAVGLARVLSLPPQPFPGGWPSAPASLLQVLDCGLPVALATITLLAALSVLFPPLRIELALCRRCGELDRHARGLTWLMAMPVLMGACALHTPLGVAAFLLGLAAHVLFWQRTRGHVLRCMDFDDQVVILSASAQWGQVLAAEQPHLLCALGRPADPGPTSCALS